MTPADSIHSGLANLSVAMPLFAAGALVAAFASTPSGRRTQVLIYLWVGVGAGFFGAHVIQPIQAGGWNFQFLFYPFLFAKWFFIGFTAAWGFGILTTFTERSSRRPFASVVFTLAAIPLSLTLLDLTCVPYIYQRDRAYWESVFSAQVSAEQLALAPDRLSSAGRERVSWHLHYHPHDITTPVLTKLHTLGFNVLDARNTPPEIAATAIAAAQAKLAHESSEWMKSQAVSSLVPVASNPTLDDETFRRLATIGDYHVISALIRNKSNDDARMKWLRDTIQARVTEAHPSNDDDRWWFDRLREQLDHLDQWWHFKKTGEWRPNHALQRTAPRVTLAASASTLPPTMQPARRAPQSLSLGSLGHSERKAE